MKRLALALCLFANVAAAGISEIGGGSGSGTIGGLTPNTCIRANGSGVLVSASGDCLNGDSAGTTAAFSALAGGGANPNTLLVSGSLGPSGGGSVNATYANGAGVLDWNDNGGTDPAIVEIATLLNPAAPTTPISNPSPGKILIDTTVPWPTSIPFSQITGQATVDQIPAAQAAGLAAADPPACPAHQFVYDRPQSLYAGDNCAQPNFGDIAGAIADGQVPATFPRTSRTINTTAPLTGGGDLSADRTFAIATNGIGPNQIDETLAYAFADVTGKQKRNSVLVNDNDCTGEQGSWWFDTTDQRFEFCNANGGTPTLLGGGSGSGTPAGSDQQVQFNSSNAFGADAAFTYDQVNKILTIGDATHPGTINIPPNNVGGQVAFQACENTSLGPSCFTATVGATNIATSNTCTIDAAGQWDAHCWLGNKTITSAELGDNSVTSAPIAANAVTTTKISDANVTPAKLSTAARSRTVCRDILNPVTTYDPMLWRAEAASTVTGIDCLTTDNTTPITLTNAGANGGGSTAIEATINCTTTNTTEAAGIDAAALAAGDWVKINVVATVTTTGSASICMTYTVN